MMSGPKAVLPDNVLPLRRGGEPPLLPIARAESGARIGRYRLLRKLGTGGMADVFLANHDGPGGFSKRLVVKVMHPHLAEQPQFVEMFLKEARLGALMSHPNVVSIYELGVEPQPFIAMEFLDGCNFVKLRRSALERSQPIAPVLWAKLIAEACAGLHYAHDLCDEDGVPLNLVHRDVSLENLILTTAGEVKVVDFGVARTDGMGGRTAPGVVKGKFAYMAPEQISAAKIDRRSDVWALGVCLYHALSGKRPFRGGSPLELMHQIASVEPEPLHEVAPHVPEPLSRIVHRALSKDRQQRFASAAALREALEEWVSSTGRPIDRAALADLFRSFFSAIEASSLSSEAFPRTDDIEIPSAEVEIDVADEPAAEKPPRLRRALAFLLETAWPLGLFAVTHELHQLLAPALFLTTGAMSAALLATPAQLAAGLRPAGSPIRRLVWFVAQHAWLVLLAATLHAAYRSLAIAEVLGISALVALLYTIVSPLFALAKGGRTLNDRLFGISVVARKGRS